MIVIATAKYVIFIDFFHFVVNIYLQDLDEEATRRTALGAGVEKISRHKENLESKTPGATSSATLPIDSTPNSPGVGSVAA